MGPCGLFHPSPPSPSPLGPVWGWSSALKVGVATAGRSADRRALRAASRSQDRSEPASRAGAAPRPMNRSDPDTAPQGADEMIMGYAPKAGISGGVIPGARGGRRAILADLVTPAKAGVQMKELAAGCLLQSTRVANESGFRPSPE
jgi:hypothetical protein